MNKALSIVFFLFATVICVVINFLLYNLYYPLKYENYINLYAQEFSVDKSLICAIINTESSFDKNALSLKGAVGLMQILPSTGKAIAESFNDNFEINLLYDENVNIKYGSFYLSKLLSQFNFDEAICAYNAGPTKVKNWLNNPNYSDDGKCLKSIPYSETKNYLEKVKKNLKFYRNKFN